MKSKEVRQANKLVESPSPYANRETGGNIRRLRYFKRFRVERDALSILENTFTKVDNYKTYRANKFLYYFVIPHLARYLWFIPDRDRLSNVEIYLFNELLSYSFRRGRTKEPNRVPVWSIRSPNADCVGQQQKL